MSSSCPRPFFYLTFSVKIKIPSHPFGACPSSPRAGPHIPHPHPTHTIPTQIFCPLMSSFPLRPPYQSPFDECFRNLARRHFGVSAYDWQAFVGSVLMEHHLLEKPCRFLCIQGTGSGKSVLYQTLSAHFKGVTIYISPLLTLGADQVNKLMQRTSVLDPDIIPIHLDAMITQDQMDHFLHLLGRLDQHASVVVFISPQTITQRFPGFISSVIDWISFIVIDELHIFNSFGRSFRSEFCKLKEVLFTKVADDVPMLFLTATCNSCISSSFERMIGVSITHKEWPNALQIQNRRVSIFSAYSQRPIGRVEKGVSRVLQTEELIQDKCIVFSNVRKRVCEMQDRLGERFDQDDDLSKFDVLSIHGQLTKEQKASYIQTFLDPEHDDDKNIRVLCATSGVGNVGIDSKYIRSVFRLEIPPSVLDMVQEMGRAGRVTEPDPLNYSYTVLFSLDSFLYLFERALDEDNDVIDESYRHEEVQNLFQIGRMLVFQEECFYVSIEKHLGNPHVIIPNEQFTPCGNFCPVCREELKDRRVVPMVDRNGLSTVLFHLFNPPPNNIVINKARDAWTINVIVREIRGYPNSTHLILKSKVKGGISPDNIKRVVFSLTLCGILQISYDKIEKCAVFSLAHFVMPNGTLSFALYDDSYWNKIALK